MVCTNAIASMWMSRLSPIIGLIVVKSSQIWEIIAASLLQYVPDGPFNVRSLSYACNILSFSWLICTKWQSKSMMSSIQFFGVGRSSITNFGIDVFFSITWPATSINMFACLLCVRCITWIPSSNECYHDWDYAFNSCLASVLAGNLEWNVENVPFSFNLICRSDSLSMIEWS